MPDDVLLNKVATVERCLGRIHDEYQGREDEFENNQTRQDAIVLNLLRACEACIDLAMHLGPVDVSSESAPSAVLRQDEA